MHLCVMDPIKSTNRPNVIITSPIYRSTHSLQEIVARRRRTERFSMREAGRRICQPDFVPKWAVFFSSKGNDRKL